MADLLETPKKRGTAAGFDPGAFSREGGIGLPSMDDLEPSNAPDVPAIPKKPFSGGAGSTPQNPPAPAGPRPFSPRPAGDGQKPGNPGEDDDHK